MTFYQVLLYFLHGAAFSSLLAWSQAAGNGDYASLIGFFHSSWEAQTLVAYAWQRLHPLTGGWLILDEIVLEKTIAGRCLLVKNRWKTTKGHVTPAVAIVMLLWTNGIWRIPLRFKLWRPGEGTHIHAALDLLSWVRNDLHWKAMCVVFDAGFAAAPLLSRINDYGWAFVCRAPCSRRFEGVQLKKYKRQGFWNEVGEAWCGVMVRAVRRADKFYLCNRLTWSPEIIVEWYDRRAIIEEVFKLLKGPCHWGSCQLVDDAAYERYLAMSVVTFITLEAVRVHHPSPITIYKLRRKATLGQRIPVPQRLASLKHVA